MSSVRSTCARLAGGLLFLLASSCLDRPVVQQAPVVTARFLSEDNQKVVSKIDLLFMIDNSQSMADKQSFLALAVPELLAKLVDPICVDKNGRAAPGVVPDAATGACPPPTSRDFDPVNDIHVGVISSSLGAHGAELDTGVAANQRPCGSGPHSNDMGHLLSRGAAGTTPTFRDQGFLNWNPDVAGAFGNEQELRGAFANLVSGVGQDGCGYESQLEAVYRFLNDPAPYQSLVLNEGRVEKKGVDEALLRQRADFLRPDSLVAVVAITDENDYSITDGGQGWVVLAAPLTQQGDTVARSRLMSGTSVCKTNPNDPCCFNCGQFPPFPAGCPAPQDDPDCAKGFLTSEDDPTNLRATRSKFQYGVDFANPVGRYVEGFSKITLDDFGGGAKNPLYEDRTCRGEAACPSKRDESLVFFAGIVGVPWQDIAVDPADPARGFQDAKTLAAKNTWAVILGDPKASPPVPPSDPHMLVSVDPRPGLAGPDAPLNADPKHGHEWDTTADSPRRSDLQYACSFELAMPRECVGKSEDCDCVHGMTTRNPLCQNPANGTYGTVQYRAKAYPGLRELEVLKGLREQGIVASICPANTRDSAASDFGYNPVMNTILDRLRIHLRGRCLPHSLEVGDDGSVPCIVMEAFTPKEGQSCDCASTAVSGRTLPSAQSLTQDVVSLAPCVCEIRALTGAARDACERGDAAFGDESGWCYVDPLQSRDVRQCDLVRQCAPTERRILRYFGAQPRGRVVAMCQEHAFSSELSSERGEVCAL